MPFRDSILEISPPFLLGPIGTAIQYAEGTVIDAVGDHMIYGVEASMPGICPPDALSYIGRDMSMDRYPGDTDDHYATRLMRAVDSHRVHGNAAELLRQLEGYFYPSTLTPVRLVNSRAVWHEIDPTTLTITKTNVGTNWQWDAYAATRWWRGWVIIDSSAGPWTADVWDNVGVWDDGGTWDSDATLEQVTLIQRIVERWKPAHMVAKNIIVTFDVSLFERTDTAHPNPNGDGEDSSFRAPLAASFWGGSA
jgi:hypothetical protein